MQLIQRNEILPIGEYEAIRPRFRARVIEEKKLRRVKIGEHLSAVFENRDTVLLQIQEMLRTERITSESAILHEIETYNDLVPGDGELSLTMFVEIGDKPLRDRLLVELAGLEDSVSIEIDGERFPVTGPKPDGFMEGRTTAVHYLKAKLSAEATAKLRARQGKVALVIAHPRYEARAELGATTLASLREDLG
ncbi:Hypothetical protein A7982_12748 [Minicystis rosea]|nr:Hypothetical protein A7982_12748 [Minicystis rosea]